MKKLIKDLQRGIVMGLGIVFILGISGIIYAVWNGLNAESGDTLTADKWNELVDNVDGVTNLNGDTIINGNIDISWERISGSCSGDDCINDISCSSGKKLLGGGCNFVNCPEIGRDANYPLNETTWRCQSNQCINNTGYAICANIK